MMDIFIGETEEGPTLIILEPPNIARGIPLAAISARRELLGIEDPVKVVETILHIQDHGTPEHDPSTGRNVYTEPYALLRHREQARAVEAARAQADRADQATIVARAEKAAFDAVHIPIHAGKCAMDLCREQAQRELGLPEPLAHCHPASRTMPAQVRKPERPEWETIGPLPPDRDRAERVADALAGWEPCLLRITQDFLHHLSGDETDRIIPPPEPEPDDNPPPALATAEELLSQYQEGNDD